jgi:hypothetical protein
MASLFSFDGHSAPDSASTIGALRVGLRLIGLHIPDFAHYVAILAMI